MPTTINEFIDSLKRGVEPFTYEGTAVNRHFIFSYDMAEVARQDYTGDFRQFIAALLHAAGAKSMKSYVATTIYFETNSAVSKASQTLQNWKNLLSQAFGNNFKMMLGSLEKYNDGSPIRTQIPHRQHEEEFDRIKDDVIEKF